MSEKPVAAGFQGTLPDNLDLPAGRPKGRLVTQIARDIAVQLTIPKLDVGLGSPSARAVVSVPKTALDEYCYPILPKNDIRRSR